MALWHRLLHHRQPLSIQVSHSNSISEMCHLPSGNSKGRCEFEQLFLAPDVAVL